MPIRSSLLGKLERVAFGALVFRRFGLILWPIEIRIAEDQTQVVLKMP
jgi:hypothetical protein